MCFAQNMLDIVAKKIECKVWATNRGSTVGKPHGYVVDNASQSTTIVYEIQGKWTLNPSWFQDGRIDMFVGEDLVLDASHSYIRKAVNQTYTYMVWNHLQYGILSSFDYTFFLKRVKVEGSGDGFEQLFISSGIARDATNPTVLQSISYILSLADGTRFSSPPRSPTRQSPRTSRNNSPRAIRRISEIANSGDSDDDSVANDNEPGSLHDSDFAFEDFSIKSILGTGRTKVYYEAKNQVALKAIDLWKEPEMLDELHHEINIYHSLAELQGKGIPRLVLHGYWEGGMYCLGFTLCGTVPKTALSESQKQSLLSTLDAIHNRGILHNDIKKENILVDEHGKVYLIDFGFATVESCPETQQHERNQLLKCIECL